MEELQPGKYVVAVSGGVDSMALLHMLLQQPGLQLAVAHVNHGMRPDASQDELLIRNFAEAHGLPFYSTQLHLGKGTSEATARAARYSFLQQCSKKISALGIVLAHHQDDVIETAILALMRGTGWRGLAPFVGNAQFVRPLLHTQKHELIGYARKHSVPWREDSSNANQAYTRNYIRHTLVPMLDQKSSLWRGAFLQQIRMQQVLRSEIEQNLTEWLDSNIQYYNNTAKLRRYAIIMLPRQVAYETMQQLFRTLAGNSFERHIAEAAVLFIKTAKPHKMLQLNQSWQLKAESANIVIVEPRDSVVSYNKQ